MPKFFRKHRNSSQLVSLSTMLIANQGNLMEKKKLFPKVLALLLGKSEEMYRAFFQTVKQLAAEINQTIRWQNMVMDFEMASKHALLREFPGVNIWVFFHFCQCVYKHVQIDNSPYDKQDQD